MRLGRVVVDIGYIVDMDDSDMIEEAKSALYDDVHNAIKYNELDCWISIIEDNEANESDIPDFLLENKTDRDIAMKEEI